jgi:MoaA/NifB/PqqE/SkfB family radical SAM enzyme
MITSQTLEQINIELTTKCQAACPMCARNDYGYKTRTDFPIVDMSFNDWTSIFDNSELPKLKRIFFNGNYGEPIISKHIFEILDYSFDKWPDTLMDFSTNGSVRTTDWWSTLANRYKNKLLKVRFAIDGLEDTNHIYRIGVNFKKAMSNAEAFIQAGGYAEWQWITFRHNAHQVEEARLLSQDYGFKSFNEKSSSKTSGFVFTSDTDGYWIMPPNNTPEPPKLTEYKPDIRDSLKSYQKQEIKWIKANRQLDCSAKDRQTIYISADGHVYPCAWVGQYPDTYKHTNFKQAIGHVDNNAINIGLEAAMLWLPKVEQSWNCKTIKDGMLATCVGCTKGSFYQET